MLRYQRSRDQADPKNVTPITIRNGTRTIICEGVAWA